MFDYTTDSRTHTLYSYTTWLSPPINLVRLHVCARAIHPTNRTKFKKGTSDKKNEFHYAPETRDHVTRVHMHGGAFTLALYSACSRYFDLKHVRLSLVSC